MQLGIYAVYDMAVKAFTQPFFVRSKGEAIRSFSDAVNEEKGAFHKHLADYSLFYIGSWDDNTGGILGDTPERVISAIECVAAVDSIFPPGKQIS